MIFLLKIPGGGGGSSGRVGAGGRGAERVFMGNLGGVKYFVFRGRNSHQVWVLPHLGMARSWHRKKLLVESSFGKGSL